MGNQTNVHAKDGKTEISLQRHESDSPLLPISQIERLNQINPARVEWVFEQTEIEAEHRRRQTNRRDWFLFIEKC